MNPEIVADPQCKLGEGPLWHPTEKRLYWTDILGNRLYWFDPARRQHGVACEGHSIGGFTIQADGSLLLFIERGGVRLWRNGKLSTVMEEIAEERNSRFNDVIADPAGRVFCGTMPSKDHLGSLYRLDRDGQLTKILDDIGCSNGMGFTPDRKQMYYTDSARREISLFDYDAASGAISNRRLFVRTPEGEGVPDGMTVDADGFVWCAKWDGCCLLRFDPYGKEVLRIPFPAKKVSCVTFGGEDYRDMYVTTAGGEHRAAEGSGAGALFRLRMGGVRGVPEFFSRIRL